MRGTTTGCTGPDPGARLRHGRVHFLHGRELPAEQGVPELRFVHVGVRRRLDREPAESDQGVFAGRQLHRETDGLEQHVPDRRRRDPFDQGDGRLHASTGRSELQGADGSRVHRDHRASGRRAPPERRRATRARSSRSASGRSEPRSSRATPSTGTSATAPRPSRPRARAFNTPSRPPCRSTRSPSRSRTRRAR